MILPLIEIVWHVFKGYSIVSNKEFDFRRNSDPSEYFNDNPSTNLKNINDDKEIENDTDLNPIETPKSSAFGEHPWWNPDWPYRILVNIVI